MPWYCYYRTILLDLVPLTLVLSGYKVGCRMTEKRTNQRFEMRLPFEILRPGAKVMGETRNVSSSGVLFRAQEQLEVGAPIVYVITFPKAPGARALVRLRCVGTVLREQVRESAFAASLERYEFLREPVPDRKGAESVSSDAGRRSGSA